MRQADSVTKLRGREREGRRRSSRSECELVAMTTAEASWLLQQKRADAHCKHYQNQSRQAMTMGKGRVLPPDRKPVRLSSDHSQIGRRR